MIATATQQEKIIALLLDKLHQEGFDRVDAKAAGHKPPANIFLRDSGQTHTPSAIAVQKDQSFFFDIDLREPIPLKLSRSKWGQMARWASTKLGRYFLVVPPSQVGPVTQMCEAEGLDIGVLTLTPVEVSETE
ncbi:hypothetical protein BH09BAC1_BH09BAC1_02500 [soil metagenome]